MKVFSAVSSIGASNRLRLNNKLSGVFKHYIKPSRLGKKKMLHDAITNKMRKTDICCYPLIDPTAGQSAKKYVLYADYYCVLPIHTTDQRVANDVAQIRGTEESVLVEYVSWLNAGRSRSLDQAVLDCMTRTDKTIPFLDTALMWNYFFLTNKFEYAGYVITTADGVDTIHLAYHRTPTPSQGVTLDRFLFSIVTSQHDTVTQVSVSDKWDGYLADTVQMGHSGDTQLFRNMPTNKPLYALLSTPLVEARRLGEHHMKA